MSHKFTLKIFLRSCLTFTLVLAGCQLWHSKEYDRLTFAPSRKTVRVLMVGDSLTYYNDMPGILQQLSAREPNPIDIDSVTIAYTSLAGHIRNGKAAERIRQGHFDYVVLQDFSRQPVTDPEDCLMSFKKLDEEVRRTGGKTIIFQNWTRAGLSSDYDAMERTYKRIREHIEAPIAPIGAAWKKCRLEHPEIQLLRDLDDRHPTPEGSYLAACVLYDTIYGKKTAARLPTDLPAPNLPSSLISTLRSIADQTPPIN